jgi:hypothetical protein
LNRSIITAAAMPPFFLRSGDSEHSMDAVRELEKEFHTVFPHSETIEVRYLRAKRLLVRFLRKGRHLLPRTLVPAAVRWPERGFNFSVQMGPDFAQGIPRFLHARRNFIYMFDAWPRYMPWLADFVDLFNVQTIFFSSRQSSERFRSMRRDGEQRGHWLPEGIAPDEYAWLPLDQKTCDVLEFGRRHESYHQQIASRLKAAGIVHRYAEAGAPLFHSKPELCAALAKAKICLCFPSSVTHPERAEGISTMTLRYLQAMLSKCVVLGIAPDDIVEVFGYDPVVPIDMANPHGQILDILAHPERYESLVERNYHTTLHGHLWRHRLQSVRALLGPEEMEDG